MNKKILFSIFIGFSLFMFFDNVKAATTEITLNTAIDQEELLNNFFVTKEEIGIDETVFQNAINSFNIDTDKYDYIISYRKNSSTSIYLYCWKWEKSSTFEAEPSISFLDYTGNQNMYWFNFVVRFSSGKSYELSYDIYNDKKGSSFNYISIENNIIGFNYDSNKKLKYMRSVYRILETSIDLKLGTSALYDYNHNAYNPKRISSFMIDDGELCYSINKGDIFFDKDLSPSWIPKTHSYENTIDTTDISKIKIKFKNPNIVEGDSFNPALSFYMKFTGPYSNLISKPVLNYTFSSKDTGNILESNLDFLNDLVLNEDDANNRYYYYQGELNFDYTYYYSNFYIVIDTYNYSKDLYLKFSSSLEFDLEFEYKENLNDYYKTINMNDIYGLYLIPNTKNKEVYSTIYTKGTYNIYLSDTTSNETEILQKGYNDVQFTRNFQISNVGYLILFENVDYNTDKDDDYYITIDTRYYSYAIKKMLSTDTKIWNPVTDETITVNPGVKITDSESFSDLVNNAFETFIPDIKNVMKLISYWFNSLPGVLRYFYVFIFFMILAYLLLKFLI